MPEPEATPTPTPDATPAPAPAPAAPAAVLSTFDTFRQGLPDGLREDPIWDQYKDRGLAGVAKDFAEVQRLIGSEERISRPKPEASKEDWDRFYTKLGRPETPDKYDLGDFKPPDGLPWDDGLMKSIITDLHAVGLTNAQMQAAIRIDAKHRDTAYQAQLQASQQSVAAAETALRTEWGAAYNGKLELAEKAATFAFGEHTKQIMEADIPGLGKFGALPQVVKAMAKIGEAMSDDKLVNGKAPGGGMLTAAAARAEYERMMNDPATAKILGNPQNREHKAVMSRWTQLAQIANFTP